MNSIISLCPVSCNKRRMKGGRKEITDLEHAKYCLTPTCLEEFSISVWIEKPYKIHTTDVSSMITVADPLGAGRGYETLESNIGIGTRN